jgi:hypothetical protein
VLGGANEATLQKISCGCLAIALHTLTTIQKAEIREITVTNVKWDNQSNVVEISALEGKTTHQQHWQEAQALRHMRSNGNWKKALLQKLDKSMQRNVHTVQGLKPSCCREVSVKLTRATIFWRAMCGNSALPGLLNSGNCTPLPSHWPFLVNESSAGHKEHRSDKLLGQAEPKASGKASQ